MMAYHDLATTWQVVFMILQFLTVCGGICMLPGVFKKPWWMPRFLLSTGILLSGAMLVIYSSDVRSRKMTMVMPTLTRWLCRQPVWIFALLLLSIISYMVYLLVKEYRYRKSAITRFSIKEGLDNLSSGLCFYEPNGRIILVNSCMQELCQKLMGRDLQNADMFWMELQNGQVHGDVTCLSQGDAPSFLLPDGMVWSFAMEMLDGICQLTAADTTQIHTLTTKLEEENRHLEAFNQRLREYGENADVLTRARERLDVKVKVHGMLGQALLATRRYLKDEGVSPDEAMDLWRHSVAVLHKEAVQENSQPLEELKKAAIATGMTLKLTGELPEENKVRMLFLQAAAESLTNAISHAKAKVLYIDLVEELYCYTVTIYNDGLIPTGPIREGGGLSALRKNAERIGGQMEISSVPQFVLKLTVVKGGDRDV